MIKKRKLLFVHLLLLVVSFLLWNCEKDNNIGEENGEQSFNRISLADFKSNITQKNYTDLSKYFKGNSTDSKNAENQTDEDFTILTNEIVMIQKESKTFYTFLITKETSGDEFYNLVMTVNDQQQIIKSEIFKYFSSTINSLHFEGSIQSVLNTTIILEDLFIDKNTNDCVVAADGFWECSFG